MNVEIGTEAALFPEKEYINGIAVAVYVKWNKILNLQVRGSTASLVDPTASYPGNWSETRQLLMRSGCQIAQAWTNELWRHWTLYVGFSLKLTCY